MKKVIFVSTDFMQINALMIHEMKNQYEVSEIIYPFENNKFKYKNWGQKTANFIQKTFFKNKNYKEKLVQAQIEQNLKTQVLALTGEFDFAFVLNMEYFSKDFLISIKNRSKKMIAYQWDGLSRTPNIYEKIDICDRFYAFNPSDVNNENVFLATNFFFELDFKPNFQFHSDLFYIGSYLPSRYLILENLVSETKKLNLNAEFSLLSFDKEISKKHQNSDITILNSGYSYEKNLEKVQHSKIIVDLKLDVHDGLSFRFFECLYYQKKLITNNATVAQYDFYHPNNIFILTAHNVNSLADFISLPYVEITNEILAKYNFKNWIRRLLEN